MSWAQHAWTRHGLGGSSLKPAPFDYRKPKSLEDAVALLGTHAGEAKILAGGQTLVPMMNFRLAAPSMLVDINEIAGLDRIELERGSLKLGALVRWHEIETSPTIAAANPLLAEAVRHIAHYPIRSRGTWAGSCAHADPAAEFPAVAVACGAQFGTFSPRGRRTIDADEFFLGPLTTALEPDEILTDVVFPPWPAGRRWGFDEFSLRPGDFALAGVAVLIDGRWRMPAAYVFRRRRETVAPAASRNHHHGRGTDGCCDLARRCDRDA